MKELVNVSIETVCDGDVPNLFKSELKKVIDNLKDENTDSKMKRKINIEFIFDPIEESSRSQCVIDVKVSSKLAPSKPIRTVLDYSGESINEMQLTPPSGIEEHELNHSSNMI